MLYFLSIGINAGVVVLIHDTKTLGESIRGLRKQRGLTLEQVAGVSGVSIRFLSELERGKPTAEIGKAFIVLGNLGLNVRLSVRDYRNE